MIITEDIGTKTRFLASDKVVGCEIDGEMVLLHLDTGIYFGLNPVGAEIWNYIQEEKTLEEIRDYLLGRYNVPRSRCEAEVKTLLSSLAAQGLAGIRNHEINP